MMDVIKGLDDWFAHSLQGLKYRPETVAYVAGVLKTLSRPRPEDDFSGRSVVIAYSNACKSGDFATFQRIGDWVLWIDAIIPDSLVGSREIVQSIGRLSYYSCFRIMRSSWPVYEELADELPNIAAAARSRLVKP